MHKTEYKATSAENEMYAGGVIIYSISIQEQKYCSKQNYAE